MGLVAYIGGSGVKDSERLLQSFNAYEPLRFSVRQTQIDGHPTIMDDLIEEILAEYEPIPEDASARLPRPLQPEWPFTDLDDRVPRPVRLPVNEPWVQILPTPKMSLKSMTSPRSFLHRGWQ